MDSWQQVKLHYIGLLTDHHQPELAETFFNSVTTKILHRSYFRNDFIFVRPARQHRVHRERRAGRRCRPTAPTTRPRTRCARRCGASSTTSSSQLRVRGPRARRRPGRCRRCSPSWASFGLRANFQIQVLSSLFYRNKGAYIVGKIINGFTETPFALPILHGERGQLVDRRRAVRRGRPADAVQLRARLLHGRHGDPVGLRAVPALADAAQAALRDLQRARPAEAGQEHVLPRLPVPPAPLQRPLPHRPRHQGHGDAGVRPAARFPMCSRSSRTSTRRRRTPRASRSRASTCSSSSTTASAAWPTRWSTATSRSRASASRRN